MTPEEQAPALPYTHTDPDGDSLAVRSAVGALLEAADGEQLVRVHAHPEDAVPLTRAILAAAGSTARVTCGDPDTHAGRTWRCVLDPGHGGVHYAVATIRHGHGAPAAIGPQSVPEDDRQDRGDDPDGPDLEAIEAIGREHDQRIHRAEQAGAALETRLAHLERIAVTHTGRLNEASASLNGIDAATTALAAHAAAQVDRVTRLERRISQIDEQLTVRVEALEDWRGEADLGPTHQHHPDARGSRTWCGISAWDVPATTEPAEVTCGPCKANAGPQQDGGDQ